MMDASKSAMELCADVTSSDGGGGGGRATGGATIVVGGGGGISCATSKGSAPSRGVTSTVATGRFITVRVALSGSVDRILLSINQVR